jgi:hypothetical protein
VPGGALDLAAVLAAVCAEAPRGAEHVAPVDLVVEPGARYGQVVELIDLFKVAALRDIAMVPAAGAAEPGAGRAAPARCDARPEPCAALGAPPAPRPRGLPAGAVAVLLPRAATGDEVRQILVVDITAGGVSVNGRLVTPGAALAGGRADEPIAALAPLVRAHPEEQPVLVTAARDVPGAVLARVLATCASVGRTELHLGVDGGGFPLPPPPEPIPAPAR